MKSLAYDILTLHAPKKLSLVGDSLDISKITKYPTVTYPREVILNFSNHYKILLEFAMQVTGITKDLTAFDLANYLNKFAEDKKHD
jgi:hypothetical protein